MKEVFFTAFIFGIGFFIYIYFFTSPYKYVGYFYPNTEDYSQLVESEPFRDINECRDWVNEMAFNYGVLESGSFDYECGKDCRKEDTYNQGITYTCNSSEG